MSEYYDDRKEYITWGYTINIDNDNNFLVINVMINFDSENYDSEDIVYPFGAPYFSLSFEDMSNMEDKSYISREYKMCRISMTEPKILRAKGENFIPTKEQIEILYNWLNSPYKVEFGDGNVISNESGWKEIIREMIHEREGYKCLLDLPIPNYLEMEL